MKRMWSRRGGALPLAPLWPRSRPRQTGNGVGSQRPSPACRDSRHVNESHQSCASCARGEAQLVRMTMKSSPPALSCWRSWDRTMDTVGTGHASQFRLSERQFGWLPCPRRHTQCARLGTESALASSTVPASSEGLLAPSGVKVALFSGSKGESPIRLR